MLLTSQALKDRHHTAHMLFPTAAVEITTRTRIVHADTSGGAFAVTLPPVVAARGLMFCFMQKGTGTNALTLLANSNDSIDETALEALSLNTQYDRVVVMSDGITWHIMSSARDIT